MSTPISVTFLVHLVLTLADIESTADFYTRVLGMQVVEIANAEA